MSNLLVNFNYNLINMEQTITPQEKTTISMALKTRYRHVQKMIHGWEQSLSESADNTSTLDLIRIYNDELRELAELDEKFSNC